MEKLSVTPDEVLQYKEATDKFLCPLSANIYKIQFIKFKLRDTGSNMTLYETENPIVYEEEKVEIKNENDFRTVKYKFGPMFFQLN